MHDNDRIEIVNNLWDNRDNITPDIIKNNRLIIRNIIDDLDSGKITVCYKEGSVWMFNEWIKKAILLHFRMSESEIYNFGNFRWYDKCAAKFNHYQEDDFKNLEQRVVPGSFARKGSYIGKNVVLMPSFINIGAYVSDGCMIDTWSTIGSCAYIGKNCHISGGVGIGGVLEPIQSKPVIIEDNVFIGARSEIAEGIVVREGAVISMGVFIGKSTKIVDRTSGEVIYEEIPPYSVVVPGVLPSKSPGMPGLSCAVIVKRVDRKTMGKVELNNLLRSLD